MGLDSDPELLPAVGYWMAPCHFVVSRSITTYSGAGTRAGSLSAFHRRLWASTMCALRNESPIYVETMKPHHGGTGSEERVPPPLEHCCPVQSLCTGAGTHSPAPGSSASPSRPCISQQEDTWASYLSDIWLALDPSQKKSKHTHHQTKGPVLSPAAEVNQKALESP